MVCVKSDEGFDMYIKDCYGVCIVWRGILCVYYGFLWYMYVWCLTRDVLCVLRIVMVCVKSDEEFDMYIRDCYGVCDIWRGILYAYYGF